MAQFVHGETAIWLMNGTVTLSSAIVLTDVNWSVTTLDEGP